MEQEQGGGLGGGVRDAIVDVYRAGDDSVQTRLFAPPFSCWLFLCALGLRQGDEEASSCALLLLLRGRLLLLACFVCCTMMCFCFALSEGDHFPLPRPSRVSLRENRVSRLFLERMTRLSAPSARNQAQRRETFALGPRGTAPLSPHSETRSTETRSEEARFETAGETAKHALLSEARAVDCGQFEPPVWLCPSAKALMMQVLAVLLACHTKISHIGPSGQAKKSRLRNCILCASAVFDCLACNRRRLAKACFSVRVRVDKNVSQGGRTSLARMLQLKQAGGECAADGTVNFNLPEALRTMSMSHTSMHSAKASRLLSWTCAPIWIAGSS